ncbi:hypothetical protein PRUB_b0179 [Pseudoalteromonas rubra]|uniref:Uncharacterized protein n=1 Tax=Pseudoalteromonas rubra TaxID=43658 RepID=A0A8T0BYB1_9GAMM|nr:hypothetical protein PRUB_b0179 [Pseudoalteromonas rubra]
MTVLFHPELGLAVDGPKTMQIEQYSCHGELLCLNSIVFISYKT